MFAIDHSATILFLHITAIDQKAYPTYHDSFSELNPLPPQALINWTAETGITHDIPTKRKPSAIAD